MEFSVDELAGAAAAPSRIESLYSPSSASVLRPSASGFNLQKEPGNSRYSLGQQEISNNPRNFPLPSVAPLSSHPQTNLRITAQTINGLIQKDKIQPDIGELLAGNLILILTSQFNF